MSEHSNLGSRGENWESEFPQNFLPKFSDFLLLKWHGVYYIDDIYIYFFFKSPYQKQCAHYIQVNAEGTSLNIASNSVNN